MEFQRTGLILYVHKYQECITFYRDILELPILFDTNMLTCFQLGGMYLMVEVDDENPVPRQSDEVNRNCLRMNVHDVKKYTDRLSANGVEVRYGEYNWGTIAKFFDPDGNLIAFKDTEKFEQQVDGAS